MNDLREPHTRRVGRLLLIAAVVAAVAATAWLFARYRDHEIATQCATLYRAANSSADSARVDLAQPTALGGRRDALAGLDCGTLRRLGKIR